MNKNPIVLASTLLLVGASLVSCQDGLPGDPGTSDSTRFDGRVIFTEVIPGTEVPRIVSLKGDSLGALTVASEGWLVTEPQNGKIVYVVSNTTGKSVFVANVDGTNKRRVEIPSNDGLDLLEGSVVLSPDASKIAFSLRDDERLGVSMLHVMDVTATNAQQVAPNFQPETTPAFSPDGKKLAYYGVDNQGIASATTNLFILDLETVVATPVHPAPFEAEQDDFALIDWSKDGSKLLHHTASEIYICNADGSSLRKLANGIQPQFSPDNNYIAYLNGEVNFGSSEVHVMRSDGTSDRSITSTETLIEAFPGWSNDGRWIVFTAFDPGSAYKGQIKTANASDPTRVRSYGTGTGRGFLIGK